MESVDAIIGFFIVMLLIILNILFIPYLLEGRDKGRRRQEVEKETQHNANQQRLDSEVPRQAGWLLTAAELAVEKAEQMERQRREAEAKRAWAEYEVEKANQAAAEREAERQRLEIKRAKRAALRTNLLRGPDTVATAIARLIRLPIILYREYRLAKERAKQFAAEREAERQRQEAERARQAAAEREAREAQHEAERQRWETERAKQAALRAEQRKRQQYWESLGGIEFERELGKLFGALGYSVKLTPAAGDQGVDLILRKNGQTTVVQCKAHKRPASPAMVRELYGSMYAFGADSAILACTGGFSGGVRDFAQGRPIQLISAQEIARMATDGRIGTMGSQQELIPVRGAERLAKGNRRETQETTESIPVCPSEGCGGTMVLRKGRRGRFWGCPRYPACRGSRDYEPAKQLF